MPRKNLIPFLLLPAVVAAMPAFTQTAAPVPTNEEIVQAAKKALGGSAFFNPKPYTLKFTSYLKTNAPRFDSAYDWINTETYKSGKYRVDSMFFANKITKRMSSTSISDLVKNENWYQDEGRPRWIKDDDVTHPRIPTVRESYFNNMIFDSIPVIIKQGGNEYYQLTVKYGAQAWKTRIMTYLIDTKTHLVYQTKIVDTVDKRYHYIVTYLDYINVQGVSVPQKILTDFINTKGHSYQYESTISNFTFKNDIPDSLFVVPKK